jgi:hypothetical protein
MDNNLKLITIKSSTNDINWFISIFMTLFSSYTKNIILKKQSYKNNDLIYIIKHIYNNYYYDNDKSYNFFNIITPEILLLKFLNLTNINNLRNYIIDNKNFNLPLNLISIFHHYLDINCFKIINFDNNFYCDINSYYTFFIDNNNNINYKFNIIPTYNDIYNKINNIPEMILLQKNNDINDNEFLAFTNVISDTYNENIFNLNTYMKNNDTIKSFNSNIIFNNNNYILDSCIIKSIKDDNYIVLLNFNDKKYIYSINNNELIEYNWIFNEYFHIDMFNNTYDLTKSPIIMCIYTII